MYHYYPLSSITGDNQSVHVAAVHHHRRGGQRGLPVDGRIGRRHGNARSEREAGGQGHCAVRAVQKLSANRKHVVRQIVLGPRSAGRNTGPAGRLYEQPENCP